MNIDRMIFIIAGSMILLSSILGAIHSSYWLLLSGFVGFMMMQSAFTKFCPMAIILKKCNIKSGNLF